MRGWAPLPIITLLFIYLYILYQSDYFNIKFFYDKVLNMKLLYNKILNKNIIQIN